MKTKVSKERHGEAMARIKEQPHLHAFGQAQSAACQQKKRGLPKGSLMQKAQIGAKDDNIRQLGSE